MATIMAGTTGKADAISYNPCVLCRQPGTFDFFETQGINPEGWNASYDDEMVTVPLEAPPGGYTITVRNNATQPCLDNPGITTANCKHLSFTVIAPTPPVDPPGPGDPLCP
jgi:hypothetical protein